MSADLEDGPSPASNEYIPTYMLCRITQQLIMLPVDGSQRLRLTMYTVPQDSLIESSWFRTQARYVVTHAVTMLLIYREFMELQVCHIECIDYRMCRLATADTDPEQ